jgi:heparosan-N-sulfate-glucuronate 5-epimerase
MRLKRRSSPGGTDRLSTAASLDLPVGDHIVPGKVEGYYVDFSSKTVEPSWPPSWLPPRERQLHVATWQWGLGCYERHLAGGEEAWLRAALDTADHAVSQQEEDGAWPHYHAMPHTYRLDPPWLSAMAQGEGASLLTRAHVATGEDRFAEAARRSLGPMDRAIETGGLRAQLERAPFLEEYPTLPGSYVLNGAIFAIWGYYDVGHGLGDERALQSFEALVDALAEEIRRFDTGYWSRYDLYPHPIPNVASPAYHKLHINQLKALELVAPRPEFAAAIERFESYAGKRRNLLRACATKAAFRLIIPRNQMLSNRLPFPRRDHAGRPAAGLRRRNDRLVLCYHGVSEDWPAGLAVKPERLREKVEELLEDGYTPTTFHDAVFSEREGRLVAITFDDGFASVYRHGRPILDELGAPATVFVSTDYVDEPESAIWPGVEDWRGGPHEKELCQVTWEQLRELAGTGWEVGSHTVAHARLPELDDEKLDDELVRSKLEIERRLGEPCLSISYPYGAHDDRVLAAARRAGYAAGCTLPHRLHRPSPLRWPRVGVYNADRLPRFRFKTSPLLRALRASVLWNAIDAARQTGSEPRAS